MYPAGRAQSGPHLIRAVRQGQSGPYLRTVAADGHETMSTFVPHPTPFDDTLIPYCWLVRPHAPNKISFMACGVFPDCLDSRICPLSYSPAQWVGGWPYHPIPYVTWLGLKGMCT